MNRLSNRSPSRSGGFSAALWSEVQKVRHSKTLWITALGFILLAVVSALFMFILKNPELARRLGLLGSKAQLMGGTADWPGFINQVLLMVSVGSLIIFGFIFVWMFGREFVDKTYYDLLSLPTSRPTIVAAKLIIGAAWSMALLVILFLAVLVMGSVLQLPGWADSLIVSGLGRLMLTGILTVSLVVPFGLLACLTRGYLPAIGGLFLVLVLAQVFNTLGYSLWFPWAIPALYNGMAEGGASPGPLSYGLVGLVGMISWAITGLWWRYADQT